MLQSHGKDEVAMASTAAAMKKVEEKNIRVQEETYLWIIKINVMINIIVLV